MTATATRPGHGDVGRGKLLLDYGHVGQYGLADVVDEVAAVLLACGDDTYVSIRDWSEGFAFENKFGEDTNLARRAAMRDIAAAITTTWKNRPGHVQLAQELNEYDIVYSVRVAPIILVMAAWLTTYRNAMSKQLEKYKQNLLTRLPDSNDAQASSEVGQEDRVKEDIEHLSYIVERRKNMRSVLILRNAFRFGFNKNLEDPANPQMTGYRSRLLFSFDIGRANAMLRELSVIEDPDAKTGEVKIVGEVEVNAEDCFMENNSESDASMLFRLMFQDTKNISRVRIVKDGVLVDEMGNEKTSEKLMMLSQRHGIHGEPDLSRSHEELTQGELVVR